MKILLRFVLVIAAVPIAVLIGRAAEIPTGNRLSNGLEEGTPVTELAFFGFAVLAFVVVLAVGNLAINRYFRERQANHGSALDG